MTHVSSSSYTLHILRILRILSSVYMYTCRHLPTYIHTCMHTYRSRAGTSLDKSASEHRGINLEMLLGKKSETFSKKILKKEI